MNPREWTYRYCQYCGERMERRQYSSGPEHQALYIRRRYCSQTCFHAARKPKYIPTDKILEPKPGTCSICGCAENLSEVDRAGTKYLMCHTCKAWVQPTQVVHEPSTIVSYMGSREWARLETYAL